MPPFEGKQGNNFGRGYNPLYIAINESPGAPNDKTIESHNAIWFYSEHGGLTQSFSVKGAKAIVEHINSLIAEIESRTPKPSEIVAAMLPGTKFTFSAKNSGDPAEWFRTKRGVVSSVGVTFDNVELDWFNDWIDGKIVEVN